MKTKSIPNKLSFKLFNSGSKFLDRDLSIKIIAAFCFINIVVILPDLTVLYGSNSIIQNSVNSQHIFWYQPIFKWITNPLKFIGIPENTSIVILVILYMYTLVGLFFNKYRFVSSLLAWFVHLIIVNSNFLFTYGADNMVTVMLLVNILFCIPFKIKESQQAVYSFAMRFLQIHMCLIYFFGGLGKSLGTNWFDGNAIWFVMNIYSEKHIDIAMNAINYPIIFKLTSWSVLFLELLYPLLIFIPKIRKWMLIKIILLHSFIGAFMGLYTFAIVMIVLNIIAFGHYFNWTMPKLKKRLALKTDIA